MSLETDLVAYLKSLPAITGILGSSSSISPWPVEQNPVFPYLTYFRVSNKTVNSMTSGSSGLVRTVLQFDCWARRRIETWDLADELRKALLGFKGVMGSTTIQNVVEVQMMDWYEEEDQVARRTLRLGIWYCEDIISNIQP